MGETREKGEAPTVEGYEYLQEKPQPEWLAKRINKRGEEEIFIWWKFRGLHEQWFGPFQTEREAFNYFDQLAGRVAFASIELMMERSIQMRGSV